MTGVQTCALPISHEDFPDERLVACRNPALARLRAHKRQSLLDATKAQLEKVKTMVSNGTLQGKAKIGVRIGKIINKYKMAKHFELEIGDDSFSWKTKDEQIAAEAALDGIYVIRTSLRKSTISADDAVRSYKRLSEVERAFRSMKMLDLEVRPIHHRLENRVRAHIFLCMLAYYVKWHMNEAWRPLLFCDEDLQAKKLKNPVLPAKRSKSAARKAHRKILDDLEPVHSFQTLLQKLSAIVRNVCRTHSGSATFALTTTPGATQRKALALLEAIQL